jgi:hypothetical protein
MLDAGHFAWADTPPGKRLHLTDLDAEAVHADDQDGGVTHAALGLVPHHVELATVEVLVDLLLPLRLPPPGLFHVDVCHAVFAATRCQRVQGRVVSYERVVKDGVGR